MSQLDLFAPAPAPRTEARRRPSYEAAGMEYRIMLRAPWDPQEPPRGRKAYKSNGSRSAAKTVNAVKRADPADLKPVLLRALEEDQASHENLRAFGTTFHSVVMRAWGEWGADVLAGSAVEEAWWQLYEDGEIHMAERSVGDPDFALPFFSREAM
jgi:hypothetical protein